MQCCEVISSCTGFSACHLLLSIQHARSHSTGRMFYDSDHRLRRPSGKTDPCHRRSNERMRVRGLPLVRFCPRGLRAYRCSTRIVIIVAICVKRAVAYTTRPVEVCVYVYVLKHLYRRDLSPDATEAEPCLLCFRKADPRSLAVRNQAPPPRSLEQVCSGSCFVVFCWFTQRRSSSSRRCVVKPTREIQYSRSCGAVFPPRMVT